MGMSAAGWISVLAHPGHGSIPADSPAHHLEPVHAVWILPGLILGAIVWLAYRRHVQRRALKPVPVRKRFR